jgi:hypothetical protein
MADDRIRFDVNWLHLFARRYGISETSLNEFSALRPQMWPVCLPSNTPRATGERMMFDYQESNRPGEKSRG